MFELNDQELEQVAGGHHKLTSTSVATGAAAADCGAVESFTKVGSLATKGVVKSWAYNDTTAVGTNVIAQSAASTAAGN